MSAHLKEQYFFLFLLALHQRFVLISLSQQVSEHWLQTEEVARTQAFESIHDTLLNFTARGYFIQAMQHEHHHRCYCKLQEVFQTERLYQEVRDEIREMYEHLQMRSVKRQEELAEGQQRRAKRLEERLSLLGLIIGIPALILSFLGVNLFGITTRDDGLSIWFVLSLVGLGWIVGGLTFWLLYRESVKNR